jgi:thiol-disulfide isomerase/thioredoxin
VKSSGSSTPRLLGAALIIIGAGAVGFFAYRAKQPAPSLVDEVAGPQAPAVQPDVAEPEPPKGKTIPDTLPDITLADREGKPTKLASFAGRPLMVNFWATWCAPCRREIPLLEKLQREHSADGFQVIGVAVDFRDKVLAYAAEMKIDYPLLIGEQEAMDAAAAFGVEVVGLPFTVFSDGQGRIIAAHMGELTSAEADVILGAVRRVNAGSVTPQQARIEIESGLEGLPQAHAEG